MAARLEAESLDATYRRTDRIFFWLLLAQWVFAIGLALVQSPRAWVGATSSVHSHVLVAVFLGAVVNAFPLYAIRTRPGAAVTRHAVALAQVAWSGILIHLTGGRIETHFHIFGSLAFLAFYRDRTVLFTATGVMVIDHVVRGIAWPQSIYGSTTPDGWRFLEHALWVAFEVFVLLLGVARSRREVRTVAEREAALAAAHSAIERTIRERTEALAASTRRYRDLVETTHAVTWEYDSDVGRLVYIAPQAARFFGCEESELLGGGFLESFVHPDDRALVKEGLARAGDPSAFASGPHQVDFRVVTPNLGLRAVRAIFGAPRAGEPLRGVVLDVTQQKRLESDLLQAQKLESVGRLATGIAHEINTPVQFVADSV
ncbi:MAG: PAS domain S-box protein, partial [Deltaproteobacteria bacterium]|nr:PAS domain S-box protein [Deltaproteobacteria bacterium]